MKLYAYFFFLYWKSLSSRGYWDVSITLLGLLHHQGKTVRFQDSGEQPQAVAHAHLRAGERGNTHVNTSMLDVCHTQRRPTDLFQRFADHLGDGVWKLDPPRGHSGQDGFRGYHTLGQTVKMVGFVIDILLDSRLKTFICPTRGNLQRDNSKSTQGKIK